jgi:hypothetical protein
MTRRQRQQERRYCERMARDKRRTWDALGWKDAHSDRLLRALLATKTTTKTTETTPGS